MTQEHSPLTQKESNQRHHHPHHSSHQDNAAMSDKTVGSVYIKRYFYNLPNDYTKNYDIKH